MDKWKNQLHWNLVTYLKCLSSERNAKPVQWALTGKSICVDGKSFLLVKRQAKNYLALTNEKKTNKRQHNNNNHISDDRAEGVWKRRWKKATITNTKGLIICWNEAENGDCKRQAMYNKKRNLQSFSVPYNETNGFGTVGWLVRLVDGCWLVQAWI